MTNVVKGEDGIVLRFGGGIHASASEADIDDVECVTGQNFHLDPENREFRPRPPFELVGTTPNAGRINGFITLRKTDGSVSMLVQSGTAVYAWNGSAFGSSLATVSSAARLRGHHDHTWQITDVALITDLALTEVVKTWNGTAIANVVFTNEAGGAFGTFRARYCHVENERAIFANVHSNGTDTPHLIVGSQRGSYTVITVVNRPSSSLNDQDPWFIVQPDNRYINGMAEAFGVLATSSRYGNMYRLSGSSAKDFAIADLYMNSGAVGDEAVLEAGTDIFYGRQGRIESLIASERYGDTTADDLSLPISTEIDDVTAWTAAYNQRLQRAYWWPSGQGTLWVYHKNLVPAVGRDVQETLQNMLGSTTAKPRLSPWSKWKTVHASDFQPTAVMSCLDPADGLEYVFFGDASGNVYRLEGDHGTGDGGTASIVAIRLSKRYVLQIDAQIFNIKGWISYRKGDAFDVLVTFEASGEHLFEQDILIQVPTTSGAAVYGGGHYYGGGSYYGTRFTGRVARRRFAVAGKGNEFQIRVSATASVLWRIEEIGFRFEAAS